MEGMDRDLAAWAKRIDGLEAALERLGRPALQPALDAIRGLFVALAGGRVPHPRAVALIGRAVADLKTCVVHPTLAPDPALLAELREATAAPSRPLSALPPVPPPRAAGSPITAASAAAVAKLVSPDAESVDDGWEQDGWADGALAELAGSEDAELQQILATLGNRAKPTIATQRARDELGTLREPLTNHGVAVDNPEARTLMKGELQPGLLSDIIQLFAQNSETGRLFIEGVDKAASIYLIDGTIVNAVCGDLQAERGFFEAMNIAKGRFSYQRGVKTNDIRIFRTAQHLIMETLRLIDEQQP